MITEKIKKMIADILSYPNKAKRTNFREIVNALTEIADVKYNNLLYIITKLHNIRIQQETGMYGLDERYEKRIKELKDEYNRIWEK